MCQEASVKRRKVKNKKKKSSIIMIFFLILYLILSKSVVIKNKIEVGWVSGKTLAIAAIKDI